MRRDERRSASRGSASRLPEYRRPLFEKGSHPFGVIGAAAGFELQFAFEVELAVERVVSGRVERAFEWFRRVEECCTRFDLGSEIMQLATQIGVAVPVSVFDMISP